MDPVSLAEPCADGVRERASGVGVADVDGRIVFGDVYSASFQGAESFDRSAGVTHNAPLSEGIFARNGKKLGLRYLVTGIDEDFRARTGFISRPEACR